MRTHMLAGIAAMLLPISAVVAGPTLIWGDFSATPSGLGFEEIGEFAGSFSFYFDFDSVGGDAFERIDGIPISSLTVSPSPIDDAVYGPDNTSATVIFKHGALDIFWIGGAVNGVPLCIAGTDDFSVQYRGSGSTFGAYEAHLVTRDDGGIGADWAPFGSATVVPEPTSLLLFAMGGGILMLKIKKANKTPGHVR